MNRAWFAALLLLMARGAWADGVNLARQAAATASATYQEFTPAKAIDGNEGSRWSGIPGQNSGVWYELDWPKPITVGEVVVRQYDRFVMEFDLQTWDGAKWVTQGHFGRPGERITKNVLCRMKPTQTTKLRIGNITNGPSFTEVEVYANPQEHPETIAVASDLTGNFIGIVTDSLGASPVEDRRVTVTGTSPKGTWQEMATTDRYGMFQCSMPVSMNGQVQFRSGGSMRAMLAADFQQALTLHASRTLLNDGWKFALDPPVDFAKAEFDDSKWVPIKVPAHWEMEGHRSLTGVAGYRLRFDAPKARGRLKLRFDGVYSGAEVYVNGTLIATHEGGFTPFEADVTELARPTGNVLALRVREHTNVSDNLDKMSLYADFPLGGIIRKVTLFEVPAVHVAGYTQSCVRQADGSAIVKGNVTVVNESEQTFGGVVLTAKLAGATVDCPNRIGPWSRVEFGFVLTIPHARFWNAEQPNLEDLKLELHDGKQLLQALDERVGLRQTQVDGTRILINGSPVKFRGTCHHDTHPTMGRAVTPELTKQDLTLIKEANLNSVRTSHYPPIPELVDYADEMGLYVEDEADFCWVGTANDLRNTPRIIQLTAELLARDRNHPSVFMWSLCNESEFGYGFERSHEWVRAADPSRPNSAATSANLEIATLHNPLAISRIQENEHIDRPLLFDESLCIYQGIFNDVAEMWVDPGMRDYYVEPQIDIYKAFMTSKTTQGSMIWCWADDIFCVPGRGLEYGRGTTKSHFIETQYRMPGRGLVGDAPWGVVDGWRRPKPEYWITKKLHSPVKMTEKALTEASKYVLPVENQYDFTNLSELEIRYRYGTEEGTVHGDVAPRSVGQIEIVPGTKTQNPIQLDLFFNDKSGRTVDHYAFPIEGLVKALPLVAPAKPLEITHESLLAGDSTHVIGENFELAFDSGGYLRRCVASGEVLLLEMPMLHVLPTSSPLSPMPDRNAWRLESMDVKPEGQNVHVSIKGGYPNFKGGYEMTITPFGQMIVDSSFTYSGQEMRAREVGLRFSLPLDCTRFAWERKAEWNVYPADHIGRPVGLADAFPAQEGIGGGSWSHDASPMGSNDFRSTKRHITWAWLGQPGGAGVEVSSDSTQSARAMVETDRVSLHINDWYGGTNVGWWEWMLNYGTGKLIKPGDVLKSHVRLRMDQRGR